MASVPVSRIRSKDTSCPMLEAEQDAIQDETKKTESMCDAQDAGNTFSPMLEAEQDAIQDETKKTDSTCDAQGARKKRGREAKKKRWREKKRLREQNAVHEAPPFQVEGQKLKENIDSFLTTMEQMLEEEQEKWRRKMDAELLAWTGEKAKLQHELDAAQFAIQDGANKRFADVVAGDKQKARERHQLEERFFRLEEWALKEHDRGKLDREQAMFRLIEQKAEVVKERTENLKLKEKLEAALCTERKLEAELVSSRAKVVKDHNESLKVKEKLEAILSRETKLEAELISSKEELNFIGEEKNRLESTQASLQRELQQQKEETLCRICLDSRIDSIVLPCLHLHFCFPCLEEHKKRSNTCPSCRARINGVLRCEISL